MVDCVLPGQQVDFGAHQLSRICDGMLAWQLCTPVQGVIGDESIASAWGCVGRLAEVNHLLALCWRSNALEMQQNGHRLRDIDAQGDQVV